MHIGLCFLSDNDTVDSKTSIEATQLMLNMSSSTTSKSSIIVDTKRHALYDLENQENNSV